MDNTLAKWAGWAGALCSIPFMINADEWVLNNIDFITFLAILFSLLITVLLILFLQVLFDM